MKEFVDFRRRKTEEWKQKRQEFQKGGCSLVPLVPVVPLGWRNHPGTHCLLICGIMYYNETHCHSITLCFEWVEPRTFTKSGWPFWISFVLVVTDKYGLLLYCKGSATEVRRCRAQYKYGTLHNVMFLGNTCISCANGVYTRLEGCGNEQSTQFINF